METFEQLGLSNDVLKAINDLGFVTPSEIQQKAIPVLVGSNRDFVGLAQTGTGKTAAFGLPLTEVVDFFEDALQAIIICPTRELCNQITEDLKSYTKYIHNAKVTAVYGGASIQGQLRDLKRKPQIVVATPGRMMDFINRGALNFDKLKVVTLDEADEMLNMGFKEDIDTILSTTPTEKRVWLFSATMPREVAAIAATYMTDPFELTVGKKNSGASTITHYYTVVDQRNRFEALKRILDANPDIFGLVFTQTRQQTRDVSEDLMSNGYNADALHGDLSQAQRDQVMARFRSRKLQVLVATDVAARGIDVDNITHVIHFSVPDEIENYNHRSGRTGRAGRTGISISIMTPRETNKLFALKKQAGIEPQLLEIPSGKEIVDIQLNHIFQGMTSEVVENENLNRFLPQAITYFESFSKEDLIKRLVAKEIAPLLDYYQNAPNLNRAGGKSERGQRNERNDRGGERGERSFGDSERRGRGNDAIEVGYDRLFINVGALDQVNRGGLLRFICDNSGLRGKKVGRIDMKREFSFVEVKSEDANALMSSVSGLELNGRVIRINHANKDNAEGGSSTAPRGERNSSSGSRGGSSFGRKSAGGSSSYGDRPRRDRGGSERSFGEKPFRKREQSR